MYSRSFGTGEPDEKANTPTFGNAKKGGKQKSDTSEIAKKAPSNKSKQEKRQNEKEAAKTKQAPNQNQGSNVQKHGNAQNQGGKARNQNGKAKNQKEAKEPIKGGAKQVPKSKSKGKKTARTTDLPEVKENGMLGRLFGQLETQDMLLIGLIVLLMMEEAHFDIGCIAVCRGMTSPI